MKVRIPAIVGPEGRWCAYGYPGAMTDPDWAMCEEVADNGDETDHQYRRVWITVELPDYPDPAEVTGEVEA